jgi:hypothetical protein
LVETRQEIEKTQIECQDFMRKFREEEDARNRYNQPSIYQEHPITGCPISSGYLTINCWITRSDHVLVISGFFLGKVLFGSQSD